MISEPMVGIIMLFVMILSIFIGFPIAFTLMALGVLFGLPYMGWSVFDLLVQRAYATMSNDVLQAVPALPRNAMGKVVKPEVAGLFK